MDIIGTSGFLHYLAIFFWILLAVILLIPVSIILSARLEKQMIHSFEPCKESDLPPPSRYTQAMNAGAARLGFLPCGWFRSTRGGICQVTATTWLSPDLLILVVVGGGKMMWSPFKTTCLYSKSTEGLILFTCDELGQLDISGITDKQILLNADLSELVDLHRKRIDEWGRFMDPFDGALILKEFELLTQRRVQKMAEEELARYADYSRNEWRYTWKGAVLLYKRCFKNDMKQLTIQKDRVLSEKNNPQKRIEKQDDIIKQETQS